MLVEAVADVISDNIIFPLMETALGRDIPSAAEIRHLQNDYSNKKFLANLVWPALIHNTQNSLKRAIATELGRKTSKRTSRISTTLLTIKYVEITLRIRRARITPTAAITA